MKIILEHADCGDDIEMFHELRTALGCYPYTEERMVLSLLADIFGGHAIDSETMDEHIQKFREHIKRAVEAFECEMVNA